jgi:nucleoside-diphosphate-sugar epimerase
MVPSLVKAGHTVTAMTRDQARVAQLEAAGARGVVCDVFDRETLQATVTAAAPEAVVHQLTDLPPAMDAKRIEEIYTRNNRVRREGTRNLLDAFRQAGGRTFIVQSMSSWYRPEGDMVKPESAPLWTDAPEPLGEAVRTVATMEAAVLADAPVGIVLRYGAFYGPGTWYTRDGDIATRMHHRQFPIVGDGSSVLSFIHVDDAASAVHAALEHPASDTFNIVDSEPARASEWMPAFAHAVDAPAPWSVPAMLARMAVNKALVQWMTEMRGASNAKALEHLGWKPRYASWREGFNHL